VLIASGDAQAGFSFFVDNGCLVFVYHHAGATSTTTSTLIDSAATVLAVAITDGGDGGTVELRADAGVVGVGSIHHLARARLSYTGFDVGQDRGNPVGDYDGPFGFSGSLRRVVVTADPIVRADHAGALAIEFATG
jgi:arylsulfatase